MCIAGDTAAQESGEFVFTYFLPPAKEFNKACGTSYICYSFCFLTIFFFTEMLIGYALMHFYLEVFNTNWFKVL